jgi:hypothetical protein
MFNGHSQPNGHFSGTWNPDQGSHDPGHGPHSHGPMPQAGLPTVIDSNLSLVVMGSLVAYSLYTKYFKKQDFDGDGTFEGCPVKNEPLNFN